MKKIIKAIRYHDISTGHRVVGHENKCRHLHGHNYRITFHCTAECLDHLGRVIDFSSIKAKLCMWVENNWDHKFLAWEEDPVMRSVACMDFMSSQDPTLRECEDGLLQESIVFTPFNPTAENMAEYLVEIVGPLQLEGTGVFLQGVEISETRKCSASYFLT